VPSETLLCLDRVSDILERMGLRYAIGGSLASGAWGEPRSTHDVDLLIDLSPEQLPELHAALQAEHYVDRASMEEALEEARSFNVIHLGYYQKVDIFVAGSEVLDRAQLERPVMRRLDPDHEREYPITAPEVVVLRKLDWYRKGNESSERQWRDVISVLRVQGTRLDRDFMRSLASRVALTDLLDRALREAGDSGLEPTEGD
jgi:hypothetical protein